jgi:hypothetical protein
MRALAALSLILFLPCAAQAEAPVPRPDVKVGDRWTYRRMDYEANRSRGNYEMHVVFAERGVIQVVTDQRSGETDTTYTSDWNAVTLPGRVFSPHTGWLIFPLRSGASYRAAFEVVQLKRDHKVRHEYQVKVMGWEEVTVPAGKFRALKVESEGSFQRADDAFVSGKARSVIWYAPEVRRWVKMTREERPNRRRGGGDHSGEELVEYKLQ